MWYDDGAADHIFYRSSSDGYYRDHIVLHEICHMLVGHGTSPQPLPAGSIDYLIDGRSVRSTAFNRFEEQLAETFAGMVLKIVNAQRPLDVSAVERRAEELFRGTHA
jgi:hypothetical protein